VPERLSRCHVEYAELLEKRGDLAAANQQLRLALRQIQLGRPALAVRQDRSATA